MSDEKVKVVNKGLGLSSVLTIIFVIAKLLNIIDWTWWWVFSPLWIDALITIGVLLILLIIYLVVSIF